MQIGDNYPIATLELDEGEEDLQDDTETNKFTFARLGDNLCVPFQCDLCEKKFTLQGHLNRHLKIHTGEKSFKCDFCEKKFTQKGDLKRHLTIHTGEKSFQCDWCGQRFSQRSYLNDHLRIHSGEKPFHCDYCAKRFPQKGHLTKHLPNGSTAYTGGQRSRMYVEERDSEMDLFIYMSKRQLTTRPRYLRLTVTVIKENCASNNLFYR